MKTALIVTVLNEEKTIELLIQSILNQTILPNEVIITDAESNDTTVSKIKEFENDFKKKKINLTILVQKGNRAAGRNLAIKKANSDILLITDAGCSLDSKWVEELTKPFTKSAAVVAGYYQTKNVTLFQQCITPYFLVMADKVDEHNFLPATRSMALKKAVWEELGGFPEEYSRNEDYVFARLLQKQKYKIVFAKNAIVYWNPPNTVIEAFGMFCRHAFGDAEAGILRKKVLLLYARYILGILLVIMGIVYSNSTLLVICLLGIIVYLLWSIVKNYRYVRKTQAIFILPFIQIVSDVAILISTVMGYVKKIVLK